MKGKRRNSHEVTDDTEREDGDGEDIGTVVRSTEHFGHALVAVFCEEECDELFVQKFFKERI